MSNSTVRVSSLELAKGMIARTLVEYNSKHYEVMTCDTRKSLNEETFHFWDSLLKDYPFETVIYRLVDASKPYTPIEQQLAELVPVSATLRRDLETGDLYVSRSSDEESASLEHDGVINDFKNDEVILLTQDERAAIHGPGKLLQ